MSFSQEASLKRRVRRNVKAPKAIAGLSFTELLAKKQQKPEVYTYLSSLVNDFAKNNEFRSVKSNVITPSRLPRKRERPLKLTRLLPARPCQRFNLRHKPRCQRPQKWRVPAVKDKLPNIINWSSSFLFLLFFIIAGKKMLFNRDIIYINVSMRSVCNECVQSVVVSSFCLDARIYSP